MIKFDKIEIETVYQRWMMTCLEKQIINYRPQVKRLIGRSKKDSRTETRTGYKPVDNIVACRYIGLMV